MQNGETFAFYLILLVCIYKCVYIRCKIGFGAHTPKFGRNILFWIQIDDNFYNCSYSQNNSNVELKINDLIEKRKLNWKWFRVALKKQKKNTSKHKIQQSNFFPTIKVFNSICFKDIKNKSMKSFMIKAKNLILVKMRILKTFSSYTKIYLYRLYVNHDFKLNWITTNWCMIHTYNKNITRQKFWIIKWNIYIM